jgi:outer membrane protein OmpA-like peptidoglycan-associated protein
MLMVSVSSCYTAQKNKIIKKLDDCSRTTAFEKDSLQKITIRKDERFESGVIDSASNNIVHPKITSFGTTIDSVELLNNKSRETVANKNLFKKSKQSLLKTVSFLQRYSSDKNGRSQRFTVIQNYMDTAEMRFKNKMSGYAAANADDRGALAKIAAKKDEKFVEGKIDSATNASISSKIGGYIKQIDAADNATMTIEKILADPKNNVKSKKLLNENIKFLEKHSAGAAGRLRRFSLLDEGLDKAKANVFDMAAFFGPGKYEIPADKTGVAEQSFAPVLDTLVNFYNQYNDIPREATLTILGFADAQGFPKTSRLAVQLKKMLGNNTAGKEELNRKLSELRAEVLGNLMELSLGKRIQQYESAAKVDFTFFEIGKGEIYPTPKITDYKDNDERRRVVILFWNILPK